MSEDKLCPREVFDSPDVTVESLASQLEATYRQVRLSPDSPARVRALEIMTRQVRTAAAAPIMEPRQTLVKRLEHDIAELRGAMKT